MARAASKLSHRLRGIVFFVIGAGIAVYGVSKVMAAKKSDSWPTIDAKIITSEATHHKRRRSTDHCVKLQYAYEVNGQGLTGHRYNFNDNEVTTGTEADRIVADLPPGTVLKIHYNPDQPAECCVVPGASMGVWVPAALGAGACVVGVGLIGFDLIRRR